MTMQNIIESPDAAAPSGPYSPAVTWRDLVFVSGQGPVDPRSGKVETEDFIGQVEQTLRNADVLLRAAGSGRGHVLKVQVYLVDLANFDRMNHVYAEFFDACPYPARTTIQAAALPGGIQFEMDLIAYKVSS
jgi:2-iminobutanoate/2-iminopropanoate deaminase